MSWLPMGLGAALGGGVLLMYFGIRRLTSKELDAQARKRGYWPLNGGLVLAAISLYLMVQVKAG